MLNLAFALVPSLAPIPSLAPDKRDAGEGLPGRLVLRARQRVRYHRALRELRRLDDRDLDDIDIARADFPALAWRHATGAEPLARSRG